ncbi:hypothetical protein [Pseudomonas halotolerans]|uniref:hypothetical protein n=1 Tax=Pseudomonas halotolerans TaxID=3143552 RepID=UPI0031D085F7
MASLPPLAALTGDRLRALHQDGFVLMPAVLNTATPRQRRLLGDHQEVEYD